MATDIASMVPPDDSGADTFRRFRFQAEIAFPLCLNCALGGSIVSIVMEHFEDIAIEEVDRWRFRQIKTRDLDLGPWKLSDVLHDHGGIHTLFRTFESLKDHNNVRLELLLEGSLKPRDPIQELRYCKASAETQHKVSEKLGCSVEYARDFLSKVHVAACTHLRHNVGSANIALLAHHAKTLNYEQLKTIYEAVVGKILTAMALKLEQDDWENFCFTLQPPSAHAIFDSKRLTTDVLKPLFGPMSAKVGILLKRIVEPTGATISPLEEKLLRGGAIPELISIAKNLRANAVAVELERSSASLFPDAEELLEDIRQRLLSRAVAISSRAAARGAGADELWAELMNVITSQREHIDHHRFFEQDVDLLMGELCELSDQCKLSWGDVNA